MQVEVAIRDPCRCKAVAARSGRYGWCRAISCRGVTGLQRRKHRRVLARLKHGSAVGGYEPARGRFSGKSCYSGQREPALAGRFPLSAENDACAVKSARSRRTCTEVEAQPPLLGNGNTDTGCPRP